ncbi:MarR family winged helix-turn-helix transcriptional regulator [Streptomyces zhihengii]|uniref:MarR family winged helix-turn-helix transcriptional regulator n=1 Tax=Streptomyces zhihengii TaxID=1818004 RepID=UPI0033A2F3D5
MARRSVELLDLLTRAERLAARRVQSVLAEFDCSVEAWRVLDLLADGEGHHMTALADHAFLPAPTLTKLVDQLVDQNFVFRRIDPADRRRVLAHLTPRGLERRRLLAEAVRADRGAWEPLLAAEDGRRLAVLLDRLASALREEDGVTPPRAERSTGRAR